MQTLGSESIPRTDHDLPYYRYYYNKDLGVTDELLVHLGASDSRLAQQIQESYPSGSRVVKIDFDYGARPPADRRHAVAAWAQALPFRDDSVDKVISSDMFCYLTVAEAARVALESLRVLRPGGRLTFDALYIPRGQPPPELELWKVRKARSLRYRTMLGVTKPPDYAAWPEGRQEYLCRAIGTAVGAPDKVIKLFQTTRWKKHVRTFNARTQARRERLES